MTQAPCHGCSALLSRLAPEESLRASAPGSELKTWETTTYGFSEYVENNNKKYYRQILERVVFEFARKKVKS